MYRYFVSYTCRSRDDGTGVGNTWVDRPAPITSPDDLAELVAALKDAESRLARMEVIVLNFQQVAAPTTPAEAWTGRTNREAAALILIRRLRREAEEGTNTYRNSILALAREAERVLDGGR